MIFLNKSKCKTLYCETHGNPKYKGYCVRCFMHTFPDEKVSRNYKTVIDAIKEKYPTLTFIENGCSKRRPDLLIDMGSHIIIVEVDENKHSDYECI